MARERPLRLSATGFPPGPTKNLVVAALLEGFSIRLIRVAHAALKLAFPARLIGTKREKRLGAGGLLVALDPDASSISLRGHFGDFATGFSHWIGVGVGCLFVTQKMRVGISDFQRPKTYKRVDYEVPGYPNPDSTLLLEFRGRTSTSNLKAAMNDGKEKVTLPPPTRCQLVVIGTRIGVPGSQICFVEVSDPEPPEVPPPLPTEAEVHARRLFHMAWSFFIAGLDREFRCIRTAARDSLQGQKVIWPDLSRLKSTPSSEYSLRNDRLGLVSVLPLPMENRGWRQSRISMFLGIERASLDLLAQRRWPDEHRGVADHGAQESACESTFPDGSVLECFESAEDARE